MLSVGVSDDVVMDICAYHCQQCVEKIAKFLILLQGDNYANDHRSDIYLEDLKDETITALIKKIASKIDFWATTIRYHHNILSNESMVREVIETCDVLFEIVENKLPKEAAPPASGMQNFNGSI